MNWLQKLAATQIMYHGTSIDNLSTILSQGLNTHHAKTWTPERGHRDRMESIESFDGVYFTTNFMTAKAAARNATQESNSNGYVMVMANLELRTPNILLDEDQIRSPLNAISQSMGLNLATDSVIHFAHWIKDGFPNIDVAAKAYLRQWLYSMKYSRQESDQNLNQESERLYLYYQGYIKNYIMAYAEFIVAMNFESLEKSTWGNRYKYEFPQFVGISRSQAEAKLRQTKDILSRKTTSFTNTVDSFSHNVRVTDPVTFRGKNKIVLVGKFNEPFDTDRKYSTTGTIYYMTDQMALNNLVSQITERVGGGIKIINQQGSVLVDLPKESIQT